jgi:hypothetical protein
MRIEFYVEYGKNEGAYDMDLTTTQTLCRTSAAVYLQFLQMFDVDES